MASIARSSSRIIKNVAKSSNVATKATSQRTFSILARSTSKTTPKVVSAMVSKLIPSPYSYQHPIFLCRLIHILQQTRGVKTLDFAGTKEDVYERADWPLPKLHEYFKNDTLALIGYGSQGHGQGLNARDNGMNVIVGVRKDSASWKEAIEDGWVRNHQLKVYFLRVHLL